MTMIIGIDLGTTNSLVACMQESGPVLLPNSLGDVLTPSVVGVDTDGSLLVGRAAKELQVTHPERCASVFKRHMGSDWSIQIEKRQFTPIELSSLVLRSLKQDAEAFLGEPVQQAVITVPAYFNEMQRKATIRAGQTAGLQVERILNEPTAAAIAYGLQEADAEKVLLVFDLGGGTFDVSIVDLFEGALEIRASSGETFLGGEDFTRTLAARVLEMNGQVFERAELEHPRQVSRLMKECEVAKRKLTREASVEIRVPNHDGSLTETAPAVTIAREQFAAWTNAILGRIEMPIRRALGDARLRRSDIDEVILVGGATRMPAVVERVRELFGQPPRARLNPDEVVALGAAVQAGLIGKDASLEDLVVTDVAPFTLGIEVSKEIAGENRPGYFMPIINRNTTIPISRVEQVSTLHPNQTSANFRLFQGESRRCKDNLLIGEFQVTGIPRGPAGQPVEIRFTYDLNGVLEAEATIVETKKKFSYVVKRYIKGISEKEIAAAIERMQALKTHPREESVNRFLLRRAERTFQELPLMERRVLESLIDGFEEALELRDESAIAAHRDVIERFLNAFEQSPDDRAEEDHERDW